MSGPAIFLPSRETLAMYEGFIQAYETRELSFDETYRDICVLLSGSPLLGPRLARARSLAEPLEKILGGSVRLTGNRFYLTSPEGNLEAHLVAEGHRKLASLTHLVLNGSLLQNSVLFWDEPEANLNPRLVSVVAEILRKLAAFGIQIFVSTHDYLLTSELSMAMEFSELFPTAESADIRFFGLSVSPDFTVQTGNTLVHCSNREYLGRSDRQRSSRRVCRPLRPSVRVHAPLVEQTGRSIISERGKKVRRGPVEFHEGRQRFAFGDQWIVAKYDDEACSKALQKAVEGRSMQQGSAESSGGIKSSRFLRASV